MKLALRRIGAFSAAAGLVAIAQPGPLVADTASDQIEPSSPGWRAGGFVTVQPKYEGSDEYRVFGLPFIFPDMGDSGRVSFFRRYVSVRGADDVRLKLINRNGFELGPLAGYAFGRDEDDADRLLGLGDVDGGLILGGFAGYRWHDVLFDISYHQQATGDVDGYQLRFGANVKRPVNDRLTLTGRVGATYADEEYMDSYFSVTPAQAATSVAGLGVFDADDGIKDVHIEAGARLKLGYSGQWMLRPKVRYSRLLGDAADSPVIETEDQLSGSLGLIYRFGPRR